MTTHTRQRAGVAACLVVLALGGGVFAQGTQPSTQPPVTSGWLGLALSCAGCEGPGQGATGPLIVRAVAPGGPAERLLRPGDTIVTVNRTITDARRMREALLNTPRDSALVFEMSGSRGRYTVHLRKQADRLRQVGARALPLKYEGTVGGVGVEVLTPGAPVVSRDSTGALLIRIGEHAVRVRPADINAR
jgi:S1-C subfamily serine protease